MGLGSSCRRVASRVAWVRFPGRNSKFDLAIVAMAIVDIDIVDIDRGTKYLYGPGCRSLSGDHDTKVP
jgi:hypothetical protein